MKKLLIVALCVGAFTTARSQIYVQGGVNLSNISTTASGETQKNHMLTSFNAGILGRVNIAAPLAFETGLLLDGRGSKSRNTSSGDNYYTAKFNPLYLEVPASLVLKLPLENSSNIFINAGPYIAMGIAGKSKVDGKIAGVEFHSSTNIKFTSTDPTEDDQAYSKLKRFDYGINLGAGIDVGKLLVKVNYGLGLAKINSTETDNNADDKNKYRTLSISLGIPLNGK
jgi:hypothetical protein